MSQDAVRGLSKGALAFFSGTILSRVFGFLRDVSIAYAFGSHPALAAFMVAYRLSNLFRRLLGEGTLPAGFVPHFSMIRSRSPQEAALFFRDLLFSLVVLLLGVVLLGEGILWGLAKSPWFSSGSVEIFSLTAYMMPGVLFICLYGLTSALLQCERKFFLSSSAPLFFNLSWIFAAILLKDMVPEEAVFGLAVAVVVGFFLQWACLLPSLHQYLKGVLSLKERWQCRLFSSEVRMMGKPLLLSVVGVSAVQVNSALDAIFARCASLEGPAFLWYAIRIEQLPLALFGIALSSALLPPLSRAIAHQNREEFVSLLHYSFTRSLALLLPCSVGIFVLGAAGVDLLYGRGDFNSHAVGQTVYCLWGYGIGLLPSVFVLLMTPAFYAEKRFGIPTKASLSAVVCNVLGNAWFVFGWELGAFSIALATSLAAWWNAAFLAYALKKRDLLPRGLWSAFLKVGKGAFCAGAGTFMVGYLWMGDATLTLLSGSEAEFCEGMRLQLVRFSVLSLTFFGLLLGYAKLFRVEEVLALVRVGRGKK